MKACFVLIIGIVVLSGCGEATTSDSGRAEGTATANRGVTDTQIVLGTHTDLSGPVAIWGVGSINAARMHFDEVNESGGVHGRQIRFVVEDTSYQVPRAMQAANKLINRDEILAILLAVGTPMNNAVMVQQLEQGVPNLFPISGGRQMVYPLHPMKFTQRGIYYDELRAAVKYFVESQGKSNICAIYVDNDYGQEILQGARDQAAAMGLDLIETSAHKSTETEFTAAILKLRTAGCDLVAMGSVHRDTILILDTARKMGWTDGVAWVGNNAAYAQVIADHESGEGYYALVHMAKIYADDEKTPEVQAWWDRYVDRYGVEPGLAAMEGYRGADLVVTALEAAGRDLTTDALLAAIESITDYTDIFGYKVSFGPEKHSGATQSALSQVRNGRWVVLDRSISF
ncbi:MAG: ABC transporter substrate-binding protein [Pseudomonadales bacterium]|jgi:branched-chain amino acid transport system substrate-binding protein|nr:ABC transporter substrate-binding protein [Pseudomonadales bacterium]MDP6471169.1 ABC transporter substrate-binding protein [Pseudomonadales bacterium]MDP6825644.1 ABC transporter substrate-binding protein [Pseudomonadales bacterium]MDP6971614.1 ABC transporter substrate-binding protein [Pseudomonadales bacterium]|tara:strand:- start:1939 stop:3138 length:1200 start_codon:yes stop_codon:yes gene_type:complete